MASSLIRMKLSALSLYVALKWWFSEWFIVSEFHLIMLCCLKFQKYVRSFMFCAKTFEDKLAFGLLQTVARQCINLVRLT